jgi:hypothetical protein
MIRKIWKKAKLNSETTCKIQKKPKLNCEMHIKSCVPYYRVIPADKELFSLTVDHNASLNKSHAVLIVSYKKNLFFHVQVS